MLVSDRQAKVKKSAKWLVLRDCRDVNSLGENNISNVRCQSRFKVASVQNSVKELNAVLDNLEDLFYTISVAIEWCGLHPRSRLVSKVEGKIIELRSVYYRWFDLVAEIVNTNCHQFREQAEVAIKAREMSGELLEELAYLSTALKPIVEKYNLLDPII